MSGYLLRAGAQVQGVVNVAKLHIKIAYQRLYNGEYTVNPQNFIHDISVF